MPQVITAGALNVPALQADDAYVQIVAPPSFIQGAATDVVGFVGTASYGPVNTPIHCGTGQDAVMAFGPMSAASLSDPYDLATDAYLAFGQSQDQATLEAWLVRVTDGTDTPATAALTGAASPTAKTLTVSGTITTGDKITATITAASIVGSPISAVYTVAAGDTLTTIGAGLAAAINANAALTAAGISAQSSAGVVSVFGPSSLTFSVAGSSNGTETVTTGTGSTTTTGLTLTSIYTGVLANQIKVVIGAGIAPNTFNVTITPPVGLAEVYPAIPSATFWATLTQAINYGQSTIRGKSAIVKATGSTPAVGAPATGTVTLAGGTDGRSGVNTATMVGSNQTIPATGLFALAGLKPAVGIAWMTGVTDMTAAPSVQAFNLAAGTSAVFPLPTGTTTSQGVTLVQNSGALHPSILYAKDFASFFDSINNVTRRVPPTAIIGGRWATLGPQESPGNKQVNLVVGTERNDPVLGNIPYSESEIGQLEAAGITIITNPIPRGSVFGIRHGMTSSPDPVTAPAEYWRLTMMLARSAASFLGQYVDELQSQQPNDPVRQALTLQSNQFLNFMQGQGMIDNYLVTCKFSSSPSAKPGNGMNTPSSVAAHYLFCLWQVTYLSSIRFLVMSLQGGTTVVQVNSTLQSQNINQSGQ